MEQLQQPIEILLDCIWKQIHNGKLNALHPTFTIWINKEHERILLIHFKRDLPIELHEKFTKVTKVFGWEVLVSEDIIGNPVVEIHVRNT